MSEVNNISSKIEMANHLVVVFKEARLAEVNEKKYLLAKKDLHKLNVKGIDSMVEEYAMFPEKMKYKLYPKFKKFIDADHRFLEEENKLVTIYSKLVTELEREEYGDLKYFESLIDHWERIVHARGILYTNKIIHDLKHEYTAFRKEMNKVYQVTIKDDKKLRNKKTPRVRFLTKIKSEKSLERQITRYTKKGLSEQKKEQLLKNELKRQISQNTTELSFPYIFIKLLKEEGKLVYIFQQIEKDIKRELFELLEDRKKYIEHYRPIYKILSQYPEFHNSIVKEYHDLVNENDSFFDNLKTFIKKDSSAQQTIHNEEDQDTLKMRQLVSKLESINRRDMTGAANQPNLNK